KEYRAHFGTDTKTHRAAYIAALNGAGRFEEAKREIDQLFATLKDDQASSKIKAKLQSHKIDCLAGLGKLPEASALLLATQEKSELDKKKMFILSVQEAFEKAKKAPADKLLANFRCCNYKYLLLKEPSKLIEADKPDAADVDFWLYILTSHKIADDVKKR